MSAIISGVKISPVNMEARKKLGIKSGDTVRVHQKIHDKDGVRLQVFEGLVLARKHGSEAGSSFTVRKVSSGVGVEKIFPLYSPNIDKIEIVKRSKVRQAKLYYIREKVAREIKRQMRKMRLVYLATEQETEVAEKDNQADVSATEEADTTSAEDKNTTNEKDSASSAKIEPSADEQGKADNDTDNQGEVTKSEPVADEGNAKSDKSADGDEATPEAKKD